MKRPGSSSACAESQATQRPSARCSRRHCAISEVLPKPAGACTRMTGRSRSSSRSICRRGRANCWLGTRGGVTFKSRSSGTHSAFRAGRVATDSKLSAVGRRAGSMESPGRPPGRHGSERARRRDDVFAVAPLQKLDPRQTCRRSAPDTLRQAPSAPENLATPPTKESAMSHRIEKDFLGEKQIPENAYYGVQTLRGKENFHITGIPMSLEPNFVKAFGYVKKAAALANRDLGVLDAKVANAIAGACDRLIAGEMRDQFVTDFIQGGAGTSTNMNANEVIANLALEQLGHKKGRIPVRQSERPRQLRPVDERHLSDGVPPRADPAPGQLHGRAATAAGGVLREEQRVRKSAEDGAHAPAGRGADVARPGVPRLGHDARRRGAAYRRSAPVPARDQPRRHRDRHDGDGGTWLSGTRHQVPVRADRPEVHPGRRPDRGHFGYRRLRVAVRRAEAHFVEADQDLQRHPPARERARAAGSTRSTCRRCSRARRSCRAR